MKAGDSVNLETIDADNEEAREFLGSYLTGANHQIRQSRSIEPDRRFLVYQESSGYEAVEEKGDWQEGNHRPVPENEYHLLKRNGRKVEREEISWEQAEACLM